MVEERRRQAPPVIQVIVETSDILQHALGLPLPGREASSPSFPEANVESATS